MPDVVFPGFALAAPGLNKVLTTAFGVSGTARGDDFVLPDQAAAAIVRDDLIQIHPQLPLDLSRLSELSTQLCGQIPPDLASYQPPPPPRIRIAGNYGQLSETDEATTLLAVAPNDEVRSILETKILPLMANGYGCGFVTGTSVNASRAQASISIAKIAMLASRFPQAEVQQRLNRGALDGAMGAPQPFFQQS